jgi:ABC-type oligopeptide transport system substrate-binding subunit
MPYANLLYDVKGARAFHQGEVSDPDRVEVCALDEVTLAVELEEPTGYFLQLLAHSATYPVPRHVVEAHGEAWTEPGNIVTNGPFRLESWQRGQSIVLVRNPDYHGRFRGNVQRVELSLLAEWSARLEMYEADSLDILDLLALPPSESHRARQEYAGEYVSLPELQTTHVGFDVSRPPFDNVRVRRAFVLATDRERLADVVWRGYYSPATGGFIPAGMPGHSARIGLPYNPEQARQLLAEAGYPSGHGFPVVDLLTSGFKSESEYLQAQWRENLGVEIAWKTMEIGALINRLDREPSHLFLKGWLADYPDPDNFLRVCPDRRRTQWWNEVYNRLVEEARRITDQEERLTMYQQADSILVEEAAIMPLSYERLNLLVKPWVRKYPTSAISGWFWKDVIIEPH